MTNQTPALEKFLASFDREVNQPILSTGSAVITEYSTVWHDYQNLTQESRS